MIEAKVKFLIVDDREENLLALEALLRRDGLEILQARSGDEALELLLVHDVGLALLDVNMPEMDGFALAELMRGSERTRHVPIIFITAAREELPRLFQGYDAGAVDFLFKPVDPRILKHKTNTFFELSKQRHQLAETLRMNEMFVAAVGHDLKTPLSTIMMAADMILSQTGDERIRKNAERLRSSSRRMARMIEDLFDLARARLGSGIPLDIKPVNAGEIVEKLVGEAKLANAERRFTLTATGDCHGEWDGGRIEQVVGNLVGNAVRHGTHEEAVDVVVAGEPDRVRISVHNGGVIANDVLPHLFDPFHSRHAAGKYREGLGLGLYIVHQLVAAHGGRIEVSSNDSDGTTFQVELPKLATREEIARRNAAV